MNIRTIGKNQRKNMGNNNCDKCGAFLEPDNTCATCPHQNRSESGLIALEIKSESNLTQHWSKRYKRFDGQKKCLYFDWWVKLNPKPKIPCHVELVRVAPRFYDDDNLVAAFKHVRDYVADCLSPGRAPGRADNTIGLTFSYRQEKPDWLKRKGIKINITEKK